MTMWLPALSANTPRYRAIADAISEGIADGSLRPGERLPTHRELADHLGVTVGTVSRGYAEAERRGLIAGEVGRGTFVRAPRAADPWPEPAGAAEAIDFSLSLPVSVPEEGPLLAETLRDIAAEASVASLLEYRSQTSSRRQRQIVADWLGRVDVEVSAADALITAGSQHGLNVALSSLFRRGDVVLAGELTYPSIKVIARSCGLRLRGVALDAEGLCPDAIARACRQEPRPAAIYVVPTLQNPTSATMSAERRRAIAAVAEAEELWILEDDIHAMLPERPLPAIAAIAPARTVYLSSVAKCLAPGLRVGFMAAPAALRPRLLSAIHASMWMPPPLMVETTCRWIAGGVADRLIDLKRRETRRRQRLAARTLGRHRMLADPCGYQIWLELPEPWHGDELVARARERGVHVVGAGAFATGRQAPPAVRLSIGLPPLAAVAEGLAILDGLITEGSTPAY